MVALSKLFSGSLGGKSPAPNQARNGWYPAKDSSADVALALGVPWPVQTLRGRAGGG